MALDNSALAPVPTLENKGKCIKTVYLFYGIYATTLKYILLECDLNQKPIQLAHFTQIIPT